MDTLKKFAPHLFYILPALAFVAAGGAKLAGVPMMHQSFEMMGLPSWFGYFIGACEVAGALGLLLLATRKLAATGLALIMVGATYFHIAYGVPSPVPAIVLMVLCLITIWWNWNKSELA